jgi:hypothetical protein
MQNYAFLNLQYDKDYLIEQTKNLDNLDFKIADRKSGYKVGTIIDKSVMDPIINALPVKPDGMYFFVNPPKKSHIDRGRQCAINFPCSIPGQFFVAKEYPSEWFAENTRRIKSPVDMLNHKAEIINYPDFEGNEEYYSHGESKDMPYMLNTSVPHGVLHDRNTERYVLTCSYVNTTYEQLYNKLKEVIL